MIHATVTIYDGAFPRIVLHRRLPHIEGNTHYAHLVASISYENNRRLADVTLR